MSISSDQPPEGRLYHLRPRAPVALQPPGPAGQVIRMVDRRAGRGRALVEVDSPTASCGPATVFEYAWATHQRVHPKDRVSFRRIVTGAKVGTAQELLYTRRASRLLPELEGWMETLHLGGRAVVEAHLAQYRWIPARDGHDCDCTCAGELGHGLWEISSPAWRPVDVPVFLRALVAGDRVRVRLK